MRMLYTFPLLFLNLLSNLSAFADPPAEETAWGDLTGQLIYDGEPPKRKQLLV